MIHALALALLLTAPSKAIAVPTPPIQPSIVTESDGTVLIETFYVDGKQVTLGAFKKAEPKCRLIGAITRDLPFNEASVEIQNICKT